MSLHRSLLALALVPLAAACGETEAGTPALPAAHVAESASEREAPKLVTPSPLEPDAEPQAEPQVEVESELVVKAPPAPRAITPTTSTAVTWVPPAPTGRARRGAQAGGNGGRRGEQAATGEARAAAGGGDRPESRKFRRQGPSQDRTGRIVGSGSSEPVESAANVKRKYTTPRKGRKINNGGGGQ